MLRSFGETFTCRDLQKCVSLWKWKFKELNLCVCVLCVCVCVCVCVIICNHIASQWPVFLMFLIPFLYIHQDFSVLNDLILNWIPFYTFANIEVQKVDLSLFRKLDEKGKRSLSHQYWWSAIDWSDHARLVDLLAKCVAYTIKCLQFLRRKRRFSCLEIFIFSSKDIPYDTIIVASVSDYLSSKSVNKLLTCSKVVWFVDVIIDSPKLIRHF